MESLPIPVVNELTNLAATIMPSIKTSLVDIKDELLRTSLTLDDGFKQYFLKFINDQISEAYNQLQNQLPKSTEKRGKSSKKRGASDDDRKKATNEAQTVPGAKKLRKSPVAPKSTHEPIVKEPIIQQKIIDRKQTPSRKSSNIHKSDSIPNTKAVRMSHVTFESPTVRKSPVRKLSAGKAPARKSPARKSPARRSSTVPKTPTVSESPSVSKSPVIHAMEDSVEKKSSKIGKAVDKKSMEIGEPVDGNYNEIDSFFTKLHEGVVNQKWWLEFHDMEKKNADTNSKEGNAIEYFKTDQGCIGISNANHIKYTEIDGVDYGFSPLDNNQSGFMRFRPKAVKKMATSTNTVEFHVLSGEFTLQLNDEAFDISTGYDVLIPRGAEYGLTNRSTQVSVIELTYLNPTKSTDA